MSMAKLMIMMMIIMMMSNVIECKQSTNEEAFTDKKNKWPCRHFWSRMFVDGESFCGTRPALCFHDWSLPLCAKLGGE
jgi:hypothetical protein